MPRPPRCRRICGKPQIDTFCPNGGGSGTPILLTLDEYEVIRLVDLEQRTHEQCAAQMDISRSTVQEIYESARQKIAACLVHGKPLRITGGNYRICGGEEHPHCGRSCRMRTFNETDHKQKGEPDMKIAVTYENGQIFQHFGHTEQFKLYEVADGKIVREEDGIKLYGGVSGEADAAVNALLASALAYDPNVRCDHHDHAHGEGGHTCGEHGCGHHSCH